MFHYRNSPVVCTEYETRTFVNLEDTSYFFYDHFNIKITKYQLHHAMTMGELILGRFHLVYKDQVKSGERRADNEESGVFTDTFRKRCREQDDNGDVRATRLRIG
jgi:hypothetical protein